MNAEPLLRWMHGDEEGVYSTKRTPGTWRLPVPITSFQNVRETGRDGESDGDREDQQGQSGYDGDVTKLKAKETRLRL